MCGRRAAHLCLLPVAGIAHQSFFALDLVLYCEAFLTTYRTFITPEELIKKLQYRYPFPWSPSPGPTPLPAWSLRSQPGERGPFLPAPPRPSFGTSGRAFPSSLLPCLSAE